MKITYINTGNSVGNETDYVAPIVIPIAAGLKQELLFEGMSAVTNMSISVYRTETLVHWQQLAPSSTMRIDLSTFAQVLPSLNELFKANGNSTGYNVQDRIRFALQDGATVRIYSFYVYSLNCPYLNSRGWVHHDERNLVGSSLASVVNHSLVSLGSGTKALVTDPVRGTGSKVKGSSGLIANLPRSATTVPLGVEVTQSIYVENVSTNPFTLVARFASNTEDLIKIPAGFKGVVSSTRVMGADYAPYMYVVASNSLPMEANFYCYMMNYGSEPKPWVKAGADASSPCVGAMTDYRNGKLFNPNQITRVPSENPVLDLTGFSNQPRIYYSNLTGNLSLTMVAGGSAGAAFFSGGWYEEIFDRSFRNPNGTVYGWIEYENKLPKDVSPNCGVFLRWLNSKGFYDSMFFEKYSIKPVMRTNNNGGNGIDYYETTVQIDVNWDNEPCLNWIQRSSDIIARIPIDICQFGKATLLATNVFQMQGGGKTKTIQFKFKVQIVEP